MTRQSVRKIKKNRRKPSYLSKLKASLSMFLRDRDASFLPTAGRRLPGQFPHDDGNPHDGCETLSEMRRWIERISENPHYSMCRQQTPPHWVHRGDSDENNLCWKCRKNVHGMLPIKRKIEPDAIQRLEDLKFKCFHEKYEKRLVFGKDPVLLKAGDCLVLDRFPAYSVLDSTKENFAQIPIFLGTLSEIVFSIFQFYSKRFQSSTEMYMELNLQGIYKIGMTHYACKMFLEEP
jgi:hypothetical protein